MPRPQWQVQRLCSNIVCQRLWSIWQILPSTISVIKLLHCYWHPDKTHPFPQSSSICIYAMCQDSTRLSILVNHPVVIDDICQSTGLGNLAWDWATLVHKTKTKDIIFCHLRNCGKHCWWSPVPRSSGICSPKKTTETKLTDSSHCIYLIVLNSTFFLFYLSFSCNKLSNHLYTINYVIFSKPYIFAISTREIPFRIMKAPLSLFLNPNLGGMGGNFTPSPLLVFP